MMLKSFSSAPATRRGSPAARRAAPTSRASRCSAVRIVAFKEDDIEKIKRDREKQMTEGQAQLRGQAQEQLRGQSPNQSQTSQQSANNDPAGINAPPKDISDVSVSELGRVRTATIEAYRAPGTWLLPAFTRRREVFAGRLAILGFAAAVGWEILNPAHPGPIQAASIITGLPTPALAVLVAGIVAHGVAGAAWPGSATYSPDNQRDVAVRPKGPPDTFINPLTNPFTFLGTSRQWGFTKKNEVFQERLAMLGFLAGTLGEIRTGEGIVAQVARWSGSVPTESYYSNAGRVLIAWSLFSLSLAWVMGNLGEIEGDEAVY